MYRYEDTNSAEYKINVLLNKSIKYESIYRVILFHGRMFITFNSYSSLDEFMNKYVSKYTCDTSGITKIGLSIAINDYMIISSILNKSGYESKELSK